MAELQIFSCMICMSTWLAFLCCEIEQLHKFFFARCSRAIVLPRSFDTQSGTKFLSQAGWYSGCILPPAIKRMKLNTHKLTGHEFRHVAIFKLSLAVSALEPGRWRRWRALQSAVKRKDFRLHGFRVVG